MSKKALEQAMKHAKDDDEVAPCSKFSELKLTGTFTYDNDRDSVYCIQYTPDGNHVTIGYGDGGVEVLDVSTEGNPKIHKVLMKKKYGELPVLCIRNHPKEPDVVFIASSRGVMFRSGFGEDVVKELFTEKWKGATNEINSFDFNAHGSEFATGGRDLNVRLYDTETCQLLRTWEGYNMKNATQSTRSHAQRIFCLKYFKYQQDLPELRDTFVTGGWDNHIKVWDSRLKDAVRKIIPGPHVCGDSIDFYRYQIMAGSWSQHDSIQIFDLRYNKLEHTLPFHVAHKQTEDHEDIGEYLYCSRFYDPDTIVAGGSGTHSVQAIDICQNKVLGELKLCSDTDRVVMAMDSHPQGKQFVFGGRGNKLHVASLS